LENKSVQPTFRKSLMTGKNKDIEVTVTELERQIDIQKK
jgi:hypothetical protein